MSDIQQPNGEQTDDAGTSGSETPEAESTRRVIDLSDSAMSNPDPAHRSQNHMALLVMGGLLCIALLIGVSVGHSFSGSGLHDSHLAQAYTKCRGDKTDQVDDEDDYSDSTDEDQDEYGDDDDYHTDSGEDDESYDEENGFNNSFTRHIDDDNEYQNVNLGYIKLKDGGKTLIVSEPPDHTTVFQCVADSLSIPEATQEKVYSTNAFSGQRSDSWSSYKITWSYNGNGEGLNVIIEDK